MMFEINLKHFIGKNVEIVTKKDIIRGLLLESYDPTILLIKLSNGYNIGIEKKKIKQILEINGKGNTFSKDAVTFKKVERELGVLSKESFSQVNNKLPTVSIIVTGGTISSKVDYKSGAVLPLAKPEDIINLAPKIKEIISPIIISPFMEFSENINAKHWKSLALTIEKELNKEEVYGVIVLTGTDTLHYISAALSFMLTNLNKPVVITCAQRSIDRGSTDALLNLICSAYISISDIAEVVVVSHADYNDDSCCVLRGTKVRKMHTSRRDPFRAINDSPLAVIKENGNIVFYKEYHKRNNHQKVKAEPFFETKTTLIKWYPNASPELLEFYIKKKYRGVVIEACGLGHVCVDGEFSWIPSLKKALKKGMIICFAPQTLYGSLNPEVYATGRKLEEIGVIFLKDMLPETAFVKLGWLLGKEKNNDKIKELMLKNLSNEFNPKMNLNEFLI